MRRLYKELENYGKSDFYPFHMPGHKRNKACIEGDFPIERDITEIDGFDDLHHSEGILLEAQNALSRMYGTRKSFFSVNGSTAGILTAISASVKKGGQILVARNCHKAVYHAIYLRELVPTYIYPQSDNNLGINGSISVSRVERYLEENPKIEAVLITSPTYDGVVSDVRKIAETAHKHGIPLIVDEAHGAHFRFSDYFPVSATDLGADVVIQSFHKTLPAMTQTAVLHLCRERVSEKLIRRFLGIYETSSPSYILMSSLDACVAKLEKDSGRLFDEFTELHGDRRYGDDPAVIGGIGRFHGNPVTVIIQEKGQGTKDSIARNFGMVSPEGYRKSLRLMKQAEKFKRPVICFVDTPGAFCGMEAEERGQGQAIAENIYELSALKVPVLSIVIGEGGSGGALALAVADQVWMLENSIYSVLSPEGFASILWKDAGKAREAAQVMRLTAGDLKKLGIVEHVFSEKEPLTRANMTDMGEKMDQAIGTFLTLYEKMDTEELLEKRYNRFRKM